MNFNFEDRFACCGATLGAGNPPKLGGNWRDRAVQGFIRSYWWMIGHSGFVQRLFQ